MHVIPILFPDKVTAKKHADMIYHEGRFQGYSRKVWYQQPGGKRVEKLSQIDWDGPVLLHFQLFDKAEGQAYVASGRGGQGLAYNARRPRKET
jgi:hypothetical protein